MTQHLNAHEIRTQFSSAMSDLYRTEVPQYGTLIELVNDVNAATLAANPELKAQMEAAGELERLGVERHGAIRVGTPEELNIIGRMFAVMGMSPVGYYDLSVAGIPVHSTAFRPIDKDALDRNPFRVFTSLLRLDLLEDQDLAAKAKDILLQRKIVTEAAVALIEKYEATGGLNAADAEMFVKEAVKTFMWHKEATVDAETYQRLHDAHRLVADVVSFKGPHINHLTPRTLDIDAVQAQMPERGIDPKLVVEGPPTRKAPILLRQTSFKALEESVEFLGEGAGSTQGSHTARFGEIEQRGIALTAKGRALYDETLATARAAAQITAAGEGASDYMTNLEKAFEVFPDSFEILREDELAYFHYRVAGEFDGKADSVDQLIQAGALVADPQTYEDFLPVSAAGIFQSNLGSDAQSNFSSSANQDAFETALGQKVANELALYELEQRRSLSDALEALGQPHLA